MKKCKNKRKKAWVGAAIGAAASLIGAGINAYQNYRNSQDALRAQTLANNENNAQAFIANQMQNMNYNRNEELATNKTGVLSTLNSNFKCGGRKRMRKVSGGTIISNIEKLNKYI